MRTEWEKLSRTELEMRLEIAEASLALRLADRDQEIIAWGGDKEAAYAAKRYFRAIEWALSLIRFGPAPSRIEIERDVQARSKTDLPQLTQ